MKYSSIRGVRHCWKVTFGVGEKSKEHQLMSLIPIQEAKILRLLVQLRPLPALVEICLPLLPLLNSEANRGSYKLRISSLKPSGIDAPLIAKSYERVVVVL